MHSNRVLWIKSGIIIAFYVLSYVLMLSSLSSSLWLFLLFAAANGLCMALIVFNISHDAVHGTFSGNKRINRWMGLGFCFIGVSDYVWKVKHNVGSVSFYGGMRSKSELFFLRCAFGCNK